MEVEINQLVGQEIQQEVEGSGVAENGTGGLLVIYSNIINTENGKISSNGSQGGVGSLTGGGSSGGGSINIFYKTKINYNKNNELITSLGGSIVGSKYPGGRGGNGTISIGNIINGKYENTYKNY